MSTRVLAAVPSLVFRMRTLVLRQTNLLDGWIDRRQRAADGGVQRVDRAVALGNGVRELAVNAQFDGGLANEGLPLETIGDVVGVDFDLGFLMEENFVESRAPANHSAFLKFITLMLHGFERGEKSRAAPRPLCTN